MNAVCSEGEPTARSITTNPARKKSSHRLIFFICVVNVRVTPSLPQRGRQPKGRIPLIPFTYPSFVGEFPITFCGVITRKISRPVRITKIQKIRPAPPCLGEALRREPLAISIFFRKDRSNYEGITNLQFPLNGLLTRNSPRLFFVRSPAGIFDRRRLTLFYLIFPAPDLDRSVDTDVFLVIFFEGRAR